MGASRRHPLLGHALILGVLLASVGVARALYVEPRSREIRALRADELKLKGQMEDLNAGLKTMDVWAKAHPGQDLLTYRVRRAIPARDMVPEFLKAVVPIANRCHVGTELIQPAGAPTDESVPDAAGNPVTYRKADLRFRIYAEYRDLGEYLKEIESMDQLVVVRSLSVQYNAPSYPELVADVTIWLYGTP
jgi:hypothetical protein